MLANVEQVLAEKDSKLELEQCYQRWRLIQKDWPPARTTRIETALIQYTVELKMPEHMEKAIDEMGKEVHIQSLSRDFDIVFTLI